MTNPTTGDLSIVLVPDSYYGATSQPSLNYSSGVYHAVATSYHSVSAESAMGDKEFS